MKYQRLLAFLAPLLLSSQTMAETNKQLIGSYEPIGGYASSLEISRVELGESPRQMGEFRLVLVNKHWHSLTTEQKIKTQKRLIIKGVYKGELDPSTNTLTHTLMSKGRNGALYSAYDFLIPEQGDPVCASGEPLAGVEQINFVKGTGKFANLSSGTLFLKGVVNNCPGQDDFLKNDFKVLSGQGELIFTESE